MTNKSLTVALSVWFLTGVYLFGTTSQFTYVSNGPPGERSILLFGLTMLVNERPVWRHTWLPLALITCILCVAAVLAKLVQVHCGSVVSPVAFVAYAIAVAVLVAAAASASWSQYYWGYWWSRPDSIASWWGVQRTYSFSAIRCEREGEKWKCSTTKAKSVAELRDSCADDPYYCLGERLPLALDNGGISLVEGPPTSGTLRGVEQSLSAPGLLAPSAPGYSGNRVLSGFIVTGGSPAPEPLVALAVSGGQLSNDHYPMYEFVLRSDGGSMQLYRKRTFFFDVAGWEGTELPWLGVGITMFAIMIAIPASICIALVVAVKRKRAELRSIPS